MPKILSRLAPALLGLAACAPALAQDGPSLGPLRTFMSYEVGQIEGGTSLDGRVDKELISHAAVWTLQEARLNEHARARFGVGGAYFFVLPRNLGANPYVHSKRSAFGITEAHGEFDLLSHDENEHLLRLKVGVFGYKYNPDAKNLGEYMFRTWTYPNVINTGGFEYINSAAVQLSGISASTKVGGLKNDLILSIESDHAPIFGLNLTDIVSYDFGGIFEVGAGFMFNNFYNPDEAQVTPKNDPSNSYYTLAGGREISHDRYQYELTSGGPAPAAIVDTGYYTLAGQKVMVRAAANLGKLIGGPFTPFKVYGEAILLGIKDYPTYYENMQDRMVYMGGVNIPTGGLLDLFSVEVEYAPNPWENSTDGPLYSEAAIPKVVDFGSYEPFDKDDMKWTVVARKDVYNGFSIYAQVANDHIRMLDQFSTPDTREFLTEKDDWYWAFKLAYAL